MDNQGQYYLPHHSTLPVLTAFGLFCMALGFIGLMDDYSSGPWIFTLGCAVMAIIFFSWFRQVIIESRAGLHAGRLDQSYRWGMFWFIFSEVMFFAAFFGALFYVREFSVPWLGGEGTRGLTKLLLWPDFHAHWPLLQTPDPSLFKGPEQVMETWRIPLVNTILLISSSITVTLAHWALKENQRKRLVFWMICTIALALGFISGQVHEYVLAYTEHDLKLSSGVYGSTFFMLTGFHGAHVIIGTTMLIVILIRCLRGHFKPEHHFGFEGVSWYWHFVDVVWICLFIFVYWL